MSKYLSEAWGAEMEAALNNDAEFTKATQGIELVLQQVINDAPGGDAIEYWLEFNNGKVGYHPGRADKPDATLTQTYETAAALNRGELNSQVALVQGKLKITGNIGKLLKAQGALQTMVPVLQSLDTEY
ncbi:MAG: SCP2 sterol-binding domain-containing protein [Actinomycetota bacterium]